MSKRTRQTTRASEAAPVEPSAEARTWQTAVPRANALNAPHSVTPINRGFSRQLPAGSARRRPLLLPLLRSPLRDGF